MDPREALSGHDLETLESPGPDGRGNFVFRVESEQGPRILKLYRPRWPAWQEITEGFLARTFLHRTPGETWERFRSERDNLERWHAAGFDVPRILDLPLPPGIEMPSLWLEFCPGLTMVELYRDATNPLEERLSLVEELGRQLGKRFRAARRRSEVRLIHKHGTLDHVIVSRDVDDRLRLVTIDLEGSYLPGFSLIEAMSRELSGFLRSISKNSGDATDLAFERFIAGFDSPDLLREVALWAIHGKSLTRILSRRSDRKKRTSHGKTQVMAHLLERLSPEARPSGRAQSVDTTR